MRNALQKIKVESQELAMNLMEKVDQEEVKVGKLLTQLVEYPTAPLDNEVAKEKYDKIVADAEALKSCDEKIAHYFKGAMILTGTSSEAKVKKLLDAERRQKKVELDKMAAGLYKDALNVTRENPDAHNENIKALTDILAKVKGSKMERNVQKLLDQQKAKAEAAEKAAAKKKAADLAAEKRQQQAEFEKKSSGLYKELLAVIKKNPTAHNENIKSIAGVLEKVKGSRMERNVQRLLDQHKAKAEAAEKAAAEKIASDLYQDARRVIKESPDAYSDNIKLLTEVLEKVKGSRMERSVQKLLDQQKAKAEAAAKRAAKEAATQ